jgi:hypothetical protein
MNVDEQKKRDDDDDDDDDDEKEKVKYLPPTPVSILGTCPFSFLMIPLTQRAIMLSQ